MLDRFGDGTFATVMDSYDYSRALNEVGRGAYWHLSYAVCRHSVLTHTFLHRLT